VTGADRRAESESEGGGEMAGGAEDSDREERSFLSLNDFIKKETEEEGRSEEGNSGIEGGSTMCASRRGVVITTMRHTQSWRVV
jgi:hypothetical protein